VIIDLSPFLFLLSEKRRRCSRTKANHLTPTGLAAKVTSNLGALARKVVDARDCLPALELLLGTDPNVSALGRFVATQDPRDIGKFKTPTLRNVALTAPYMHNASVETLEKAVDLELYGRGTEVRYPIALTVTEKADLVLFLKALTSGKPEPVH
jgi:cytochrome c peroxidase